MGLKDIFITPVLFLIILLFFLYRAKKIDEKDRKLYLLAFAYKAGMTLVYGFIYQFYYQGGDTLNYFYSSEIIWELFTREPFDAIQVLFTSAGDYKTDMYPYVSKIYFFRNTADWNIIRLSAFIGLFCFHTYNAIALVFSCFSFLCSWKLFYTLKNIYPSKSKYLGVIVFFFPSIIFWTSGLNKDTITWGLFCLLLNSIIVINRKKSFIKNIFILLLCSYLLYFIRGYLLFSLLFCAFPYLFASLIQKEKNLIVKFFIAPLLTLILGMGFYLFFYYVIPTHRDFSSDRAIIRKITGFHRDNLFHTGGTSYSLDIEEYSLQGFLSASPQALEVTFLRPYFYELENFFMLFASIESFITGLFFIIVLFRIGVYRFFLLILKKKELLFFFSFALLFGFMVGITSYNFGALMRFKVPALFTLFLFFYGILYHWNHNKKGVKK